MMFRTRKPSAPASPGFDAPIRPDIPFFAIGDVHGCDRLLENLLIRLDALRHPEAVLVMTGDYIDRGEDSARVMRRLMVLSEAAGDLMHCIMGNHEMMLLDMIDDPAKYGPRWLRHGGLQTLASYRVQPVLGERPASAWNSMRDQMVAAMGPETINWLRERPLYWQSGNVIVLHAGADPALPIAEQSSNSLLWGHPEFHRTPRQDGLWIVHGHTIVDTPHAVLGRISTDTGAYATGVLSAALVESDNVSFIQS